MLVNIEIQNEQGGVEYQMKFTISKEQVARVKLAIQELILRTMSKKR